jgi:hypothetical protein
VRENQQRVEPRHPATCSTRSLQCRSVGHIDSIIYGRHLA